MTDAAPCAYLIGSEAGAALVLDLLCPFGAARRVSVSPLSRVRAISSGVERLVYTENVGGSIPSSPTIFTRFRFRATRGEWSDVAFQFLMEFGVREEGSVALGGWAGCGVPGI